MNKRVWIVLLLTVALAGGAFWWSRRAPRAAENGGGGPGGRGRPTGPVPVIIAEVKQQDVPIFLDGLGVVQAFNSVLIKPRIDGQLERIAFTEGQDVQVGDLLAVIDPRPFQAQVSQAEAKKRQDEAQLENARSIFARNADLLKKGVLDQQSYDSSRFQADQLQAVVQADQAALENAAVQLGYTRIVSPIDGRVGIRQVDVGNIVQPSDATGIVVVTQLRPISVVFTLPEKQLQRVLAQKSETPELKVQVVDRSNTTKLAEGILSVIDNQIDPATGTVKLKALFPNEDEKLWPGQFVNARLLLTTRIGGTVIPSSGVQRGPNGAYVYVVTSENKAEMRAIRLGESEANMALIEEGVVAGEKVVIDGQYKLQPGSPVEVVTRGGPDASGSLPKRSEGQHPVEAHKGS